MMLGVDVGFAESQLFQQSLVGWSYVLGLELLQLAAGAASLGLVYRWGEVWPWYFGRWTGRPINPWIPLGVGVVGNGVLYVVIWGLVGRFAGQWLGLWEAWVPNTGMSSGQNAWFLAAYVPLVTWPVFLSIALLGFWRRHWSAAMLDSLL